MESAYGVFSVQNYWEKGIGFKGEIEQGKLIADIALEKGVSHFIQSTMATANRIEDVSHFHSKYLIEEHIKALSIHYTFIETVYLIIHHILLSLLLLPISHSNKIHGLALVLSLFHSLGN